MSEADDKLWDLVAACRQLVKRKTSSKGPMDWTRTDSRGQTFSGVNGSWTNAEIGIARALEAYEASR